MPFASEGQSEWVCERPTDHDPTTCTFDGPFHLGQSIIKACEGCLQIFDLSGPRLTEHDGQNSVHTGQEDILSDELKRVLAKELCCQLVDMWKTVSESIIGQDPELRGPSYRAGVASTVLHYCIHFTQDGRLSNHSVRSAIVSVSPALASCWVCRLMHDFFYGVCISDMCNPCRDCRIFRLWSRVAAGPTLKSCTRPCVCPSQCVRKRHDDVDRRGKGCRVSNPHSFYPCFGNIT
jgi:hypothetical protein